MDYHAQKFLSYFTKSDFTQLGIGLFSPVLCRMFSTILLDTLCLGHFPIFVFLKLSQLIPELVKFYRSAAGDPEDRVTNVRKVRRHYDFVVIGDSSSILEILIAR